MHEARLKDIETGYELSLSRVESFRYGEMINQHYTELKVLLRNFGIPFFEFQTEMDLALQLRNFLEG
jgi:hypothetical protein